MSSAEVQRRLQARVRSRARSASASRHHLSICLPVSSRPRDQRGTKEVRPGLCQSRRWRAQAVIGFAGQCVVCVSHVRSLACSNWAAASRQHLPTTPASRSPGVSHQGHSSRSFSERRRRCDLRRQTYKRRRAHESDPELGRRQLPDTICPHICQYPAARTVTARGAAPPTKSIGVTSQTGRGA